ncbi:MAG: ABC transporter substrate-binding protein, partial [Myxococcota bacterium]
LLSGTAMAAAAKAQELGVPLISLSRAEGLTELGSWVFRNALADAAQARALVDYAVEHLDAERFGILYPDHEYGRNLMRHFWDEVESRRLEVRGVERYAHDQTTFQPLIRALVGRYHLQYRHDYMNEVRRIRSEVTDPIRRRRALSRALDDVRPVPEFDVLFIPDSYRSMGLIAPALAVEDVITNVCDRRDIRRIKETTGRDRLTEVRLLGPNAWHHPELVTRGGRHVRCSVFVDGFFPESTRGETKAFVDLYRQTHGASASPSYLEAYGYDTAAIVRHLIEERRPSDRAAFREELIGLASFPGATGETRFRADGEADKPLFLLTVDGDEIVEIDPEPLQEETPTG